MPVYEYVCTQCGERFERLVAYAEADRVCCRRCGAPEVRRLVSVIAPPRPARSSEGCGCGGSCNCAVH
ncbi:MAG: zinc ribbon domain-containing protein [candidate division GAL15 bacterium]